MEPVYDVVWPKSPQGVQARRLADRRRELDGARIAFVWDYVFRGDEIFPIVEQALTSRYPDLEVVGFAEFGNSHGGDEAGFIANLPDALASHQIDAVVSGMGC